VLALMRLSRRLTVANLSIGLHRPLYIDENGVVTPWVPLYFVVFIVLVGK
jgi:hypothetical protein